ncbi:hypothetical protein AAJ76_443000512 [Vairimorpha ceranae]|uniref:Uncharacterized protein n=1 Tax=Vairimorpha ceranae TaxID=40302 RepID=A0A0F9W6V5_9MICR|nr:hypothetical protein AAJ76_443000512 [Vairimorpha ceranae]KKO73576.1 hypothetical protein AAJ76_443000512 [Vairimorpha ceranae]
MSPLCINNSTTAFVHALKQSYTCFLLILFCYSIVNCSTCN